MIGLVVILIFLGFIVGVGTPFLIISLLIKYADNLHRARNSEFLDGLRKVLVEVQSKKND